MDALARIAHRGTGGSGANRTDVRAGKVGNWIVVRARKMAIGACSLTVGDFPSLIRRRNRSTPYAPTHAHFQMPWPTLDPVCLAEISGVGERVLLSGTGAPCGAPRHCHASSSRSEVHTSELQHLLHLCYADSC